MMQTAIKSPQGNFLIITEQYEIGVYSAFYSADENFKTLGRPSQSTHTGGEEDFHRTLRERAVNHNDTIVEDHSTPLNQ